MKRSRGILFALSFILVALVLCGCTAGTTEDVGAVTTGEASSSGTVEDTIDSTFETEKATDGETADKPPETDTDAADTGSTAPDTTGEQETKPDTTEPQDTESDITEPEATEPDITEPEATEPEVTEPETTEPETTAPETTVPETTEPETTEPAETEPETVEYTVKHYWMNLDGETYGLVKTETFSGTEGSYVTPSRNSYEGFTAPKGQRTELTEGVVIEYYYTRNKYNVTITCGDGITSPIGEGSYFYGAYVTVNVSAVKGYSVSWSGFDGYKYRDECSFYMPAADVSLKALAKANEYTVSFDANGGSGSMSRQSFVYDAIQNLKENAFTREGHIFKGWSTTKDGSVEYTDKQSVKNLAESGNVVLYAVWELDENYVTVYAYHYKMNLDGTYSLADRVEYTGKVGDTIIPVQKMYEGFTQPEPQTGIVKDSQTPLVEYYYTRNQYTVELSKGSGIASVSGAGTYYYGEEVTIKAELLDGYRFKNWTGSATYSLSECSFEMPASNVKLTASAIDAAVIDLTFPSDFVNFMTAPGEDVFGEHYEAAMDLYNGIIEGPNQPPVIDPSYTTGAYLKNTDWRRFIKLFEEYALNGVLSLSVENVTIEKDGISITVNWKDLRDSYNSVALKRCLNALAEKRIDLETDHKLAVGLINDWMCGYLSYSASNSDYIKALNNRSGDGVAYAKIFKTMCNMAGIECEIVTGETKLPSGKVGAHSWNRVLIDDSYYFIDVAANDWTSTSKYSLAEKLWTDHTKCSVATQKGTAYAIFSFDDCSLTFYNNDDVVAVGDIYNGKVVSDIFRDIEYVDTTHGRYFVPWHEYTDCITSVKVAEAFSPNYVAYWFYFFRYCESVDVSLLNVSRVTSMRCMFDSCGDLVTNFTLSDITGWDTSAVTDMRSMFYDMGEKADYILDLSGWDVSSVIDYKSFNRGVTSKVIPPVWVN